MPYLGKQKPTETTSSVLRSTYTGTGSTTTYALPGPVANETSIIATINGVTQQDGAYSTDGSNIVFVSAPASGDAIEIRTISDVGMSYAPSAGSVVTGILADGAVTTDKIANASITTAKIADGAIIQSDLATNVVGNGPAFFAYASTTTTLTAAADVKVILDTELFDTNNNYSTANSRFTPTVAGYYQVNCVMTVNYWNAIILSCSIFKNGSVYSSGNTAYPQTTGGVRVTVSSLVYMNGTTDYLEMYGFNYAATSSNVVANAQSQTNFSAVLVRSA